MRENTFEDSSVLQLSLTDSLAFDLSFKNGVEVARACELENTGDAWRYLGNSEDLLVVVFADCSVAIFD